MRLRLLALTAAALLAAVALPALAAPPATRVEVVVDSLHGVAVEDPYRWLEDGASAETRAWIGEQRAYTRQVLDGFPGRARLITRLGQLLKVDAVGTPIEAGGRYFYSKRAPGQEQRVLLMRQGPGGAEQVLLDPHPLSADRTTSVTYLDVSRDGALAAIGTRLGGADEVEVGFLDVTTRRPLADRLPRARYFDVAIAGDRRGVYYARSIPDGPRVFYHPFGGAPAKDVRLFGDGYGPDKIISLALSDDHRWLTFTVLHGSAGQRTEVWVQELARGGPPVPIVNDLDAAFTGHVAGDLLYLRTTWEAPRGRIVRVDLRDPARARWREIVPQGEHALQGFALAGGRLVVSYLEDAVSRVRVFGPEGRRLGEVAFPTLGTVSGLSGRWSNGEAFFTFSSFTTPPTIYRYDVAGGVRTEWWRSPAPVASARFETRQVWFTSRDGTRIPMFLVHRKGLALDGQRPVLLTGYGGFSQSRTPRFSENVVLLAEQGGVAALPCLRGGGEFGEAWHRDGMLERKQNTFDDFIAAAEWLISNGITSSEKLAIQGGSNGGLLVGAFLTQRPGLCRAVVCSLPLLDMLRYHRFLVGRYWVPEYGSADDPAQFPFLRAYSPYHHVEQGTEYPAVMFVSGDSDTRVDPLHARKMTARLQAATGSDPARRPVLLQYDVAVGHSGGKPLTRQIESDADHLLFLFTQLGMTGAGANPIDTPLGGTRP